MLKQPVITEEMMAMTVKNRADFEAAPIYGLYIELD